jgi:Phage integrase family
MMDRAATGASLTLMVHPHVLRHACGFALASAGHDTRALQAYLGHRNIPLHGSRPVQNIWKNRAPPVLNPLQSQCRPSSSATQAHLGNEHRSIPRHPVDWRLQRGGATARVSTPSTYQPGADRYDETRTGKHSPTISCAARLIARAGGGLCRRFPLFIRYPGEGRADASAQADQRADGMG